MTDDWIKTLFASPEMLRMGHAQRSSDLNLGLGWLYYSLARIYRPKLIVCIGSWRGFVPIVFGKGLKDNGEGGRVVFIDPSMVDEHWKDPDRTNAWFGQFGIDNIQHYCMTTQQFVNSADYRILSSVGLLFVDGMHTKEQAKFDHESFTPLMNHESITLFHDSVSNKKSKIYGRENIYTYSVVDYIDELRKKTDFQIIDFPVGGGVTLVKTV